MAGQMAARITNLERYQCMFTWYKEIPYEIDSQWIVNTVEDKLLTSDCDWQSIVYHYILCYENFKLKKDSKARDHLVECESIISNSECISSSPLISRNVDSLKFVLHSSWLHLISKTVAYDTYQHYTSEMMLYKKMDKKQKAGVVAIHTACLMEYGRKGNLAAPEVIKLAIKYDEHEGHWHYLKGKALHYERVRCIDIQDVPPSKEELECFQLASFYDEDTPSHSLGLAASLYDSVKKEKGPCQIRDKATSLYKSALEKWPNSPYVNLMCASGLLYYAYPVRDTRLVDQLVSKMLRLTPKSSHVNLLAGIFFKWPNNNQVAADRHFNLAKKRYSSLVDDIRKGNVQNYRLALLLGITDPAPVAFLQDLQPDGDDSFSDDDPFNLDIILPNITFPVDPENLIWTF